MKIKINIYQREIMNKSLIKVGLSVVTALFVGLYVVRTSWTASSLI